MYKTFLLSSHYLSVYSSKLRYVLPRALSTSQPRSQALGKSPGNEFEYECIFSPSWGMPVVQVSIV